MSPVKALIVISAVLVFAAAVHLLGNISTPDKDIDSFVYHHRCSQPKYFSGFFKYFSRSLTYESNVNSLLNSMVSSAFFTTYAATRISGRDQVYDLPIGMYQCRGELSSGYESCFTCVSEAVTRLKSLCLGAYGGEVLLEGCFVKYENFMFFGELDKTVLVRMCGPSEDNSALLTRTNALVDVLLTSKGVSNRVGRSKEALATAQCTGDLGARDCQECLVEAIQQLRSMCGITTTWGDVHLAQCYVRYLALGATSHRQDFKIWLVAKLTEIEQGGIARYKSLINLGQDILINKFKSFLLFAFYGIIFLVLCYISILFVSKNI